jgi:hypothetical protein
MIRVKIEIEFIIELESHNIVLTLHFYFFLEMNDYNGFIENNYNAQMIKLQSIVDEIDKEYVKKIWKIYDI